MKNFMFTKGAKDWNEDSGYVCENFGFVLDGATGLLGEKYSDKTTDAEWYSNRWCEYLKTALADLNKPIIDILEDEFDNVVKEYKKIAGNRKIDDFPGATLSIVRDNGKDIEFYALADSPILIQDIFDNTYLLVDTRCNLNDYIIHTIVKDIAVKEKKGVVGTREKYADIVMSGRLKSNKFGGYYVLSNSKEALRQGIYDKMPRKLVKKVLIMSDGYSQIIDTFKFMTEEELISKINSISQAEKFYNKLVILQQKDKDGDRVVRFKTTDDATLVCMNFEN